jgi:hypothetical protein
VVRVWMLVVVRGGLVVLLGMRVEMVRVGILLVRRLVRQVGVV